MTTLICRTCNTEKRLSDFYEDTRKNGHRARHGRRTPCKACQCARGKAISATEGYRTWAREYRRQRRSQEPELERERLRKWRREHPEQYKATVAKNNHDSYRRNKAHHKARKLKWRKENPDRHCAAEARRRARKLGGMAVEVTREDWHKICARYDNACAYCGTRTKLTRDHVLPLSRGGNEHPDNLVPACMSCNSSKRAKLISEWKPEWKPR